MKRNVGILIFEEAEVLDFAGPFEVFAVASEIHDFKLFNVFTLAKEEEAVLAVNGLSVNPTYSYANAPKIDILIVAGGNGTRALMKDQATLDFVKRVYPSCEFLLTICSGARILAALDMLDGKPFCTHNGVYGHMKELAPTAIPEPNKRFTWFDNVYSSGGISAGIDLSFHIVEKLFGKEVADNTSAYMEYEIRYRV